MRILYRRSVWLMVTIYMALWLAVMLVGGVILESFKDTINASLGLTGFRTESTSNEDEDLEYFKSDYVKTDAQGNPLTTTSGSYEHQVYDSASLRQAALEKADQVQREGTTILWNENNGLPLAKGNKVSLFSHSTVDWAHSGTGSGRAQLSGGKTAARNMQQSLNNAGLSVNGTLWNFYKSGAGSGSTYTRDVDAWQMNEVPWSVYTTEVKNSFATYGDAAIIVISRKAGEATSGRHTYGMDVTMTDADTPSGDMFDLSEEERDMFANVISLKNSGTFKKVILLLNTPTDIRFDALKEYKAKIDSCLWVGQTGYRGLEEVGRILVGESIPSGHLADTFLYNQQSNPAAVNSTYAWYTNHGSFSLDHGAQESYMVYQEGIYLGYKYYETRYEDTVLNQGNARSTAGKVCSSGNWMYSQEVAFPFGYGASYTTFEYSNYQVAKQADGNYKVTLTVKNTGTKAGADAVQVYVQKPYTEYDKQYGIEQASVNLAGFAKTALLQPNKTEDVEIIVRDDAFKTYDANNKKTYILEKGTYYIAVGQDAHDAINNILAAKGKTPANTDNVMDATGNSALVHSFPVASDDFTTYSVSEQTGNAITNQFDNADWNKYEYKSEGEIKWLSRNDWAGTYPTAKPALKLNDDLAKDLAWNKTYAADPNDEMPKYEQKNGLNLIDVRGLDYDDPTWDLLLDQLSLEEQINFLAFAYHGTPAIVSIAKPGEQTKDGPMGVRIKYLDSSVNEYTVSFPAPVVLAASFNAQLALEAGELMGEDMMHAGITGWYAPGANLHRTTYAGRNYEYFSEDGFLSGIMAKQEVAGVQSKGCYVNLKHFALNDQESNRHGVCIWANEQTIREVYLQAFEYSVTEANCTGIMSAFNRIGPYWSGAHKGLCTEVLRNEWGFTGFVLSDCSWRKYMGVVDGIMAGNDNILYASTTTTAYYAAATNATIAKAMRESTKRVLYVVVNSNAMNGYSASTRVYEVREWWQELVSGVQVGLGIATGVLALITAAAFVFHKQIAAVVEPKLEEKWAKFREIKASGKNVFITRTKDFFCIGKPWNAERIIKTAVSGLLVGAIIFTAIYVPVTIGNIDEYDTLGTVAKYKFEAECGNLKHDLANNVFSSGIESDRTEATANYPSGGAYVGNINKMGAGSTFTYNITAPENKQVSLGIRAAMGTSAAYVKDVFTLKVNGEIVDIMGSAYYPKFSNSNEALKYFDWLEQDIATINLNKGDNKIELIKINGSGTNAGTFVYNLDYLYINSGATLQWTSEVGVGHSYGEITVRTEPTYTTPGLIGSDYCTTCRDKISNVLPEVSTTNGYTLVSNGTDKDTWKYTFEGQEYTFEVPHLTSYDYSVNDNNIFVAERGGSTLLAPVTDKDYNNNSYYYYEKLQHETFTMTVSVEKDTTVQLVFSCVSTNKKSYSYASTFKDVLINGVADGVTRTTGNTPAFAGWIFATQAKDCVVATLSLKAGTNVITVVMGENNVNIGAVKFVSDTPVVPVRPN